MGVGGLTSYLRENKHSISETLELHKWTKGSSVTRIVVDAWSFIYHLHQTSSIPWVFGGEYDAFTSQIHATVKAWLNMGLDLSFVFDGPEKSLKFPTSINRMARRQAELNELFWRVSSGIRVTSRYLEADGTIPPLVYQACVDTLLELSSTNRSAKPPQATYSLPDPSVKVYFADREADAFVVELAVRIGAYVAATDSDFVVFDATDYKGYIPLDEIEWKSRVPLNHQRVRSITDTSWRSYKGANKDDFSSGDQDFLRHVSLFPPASYCTINLPVYTPNRTAKSLGIYPKLLPILAATAGNDYTPNIHVRYGCPASDVLSGRSQLDFFVTRRMRSMERVLLTANRVALAAQKINWREAEVLRIPDLVHLVVMLMLVEPEEVTGQEIVELETAIAASALQYQLDCPSARDPSSFDLWSTPFCPVHRNLMHCDIIQLTSPRPNHDSEAYSISIDTAEARWRVQKMYLDAYRKGQLDSRAMDLLITGMMFPRPLLESPELESANGEAGAGGELRRWVYAILDEGVGLYQPSEFEPTDNGEIKKEVWNDEQLAFVKGTSNGQEANSGSTSSIFPELRKYLRNFQLGFPLQTKSVDKATSLLPKDDTKVVVRSNTPPHQSYVLEHVHSAQRIEEKRVIVQDLNDLLGFSPVNGSRYHKAIRPHSNSYVDFPLRTSRSIPIQLDDEMARFNVLLQACGSNIGIMKNLKKEWLFPVLTVRWLIRHGGIAAKVAATKDVSCSPLMSVWTRDEVRAVLGAFGLNISSTRTTAAYNRRPGEIISLSTRPLQLMARTMSVISTLRMLIQVLFLTDRVSVDIRGFKGSAFHSACRNKNVTVDDTVWKATVGGLEQYLGKDEVKVDQKGANGNACPKRFGAKRSGYSAVLYTLLSE